jgi:hypothetical protein
LIASKPNAYTPASVAQAVHGNESCLVASDPNNYNYSSGVETAVKNCASTIKSAVTEYNAINLVPQYRIDYNYSNGTTVEHYYFAEGTTAAVVGGHAPALQAAYFDETGHYTFTEWDKDFADVTADETYTRLRRRLLTIQLCF